MQVLQTHFGWNDMSELPDSYKDLLNDVIKATRLVNKISFNPPVIGSLPLAKPEVDKDKCAHTFAIKGEIFRCTKCNTTMGQWMKRDKKARKAKRQ